jgi:predicted component of type VI protein secretion system
MARLSITLPDSPPAVHELTEQLNTIGRAPENSIRLDEPSVSGRHAELMLAGEVCYLKDLDSTNGTLVNGQPVTNAQLRSGDRIRFGIVEACYECDVAGSAQPLPRPDEVEARPAELSARPADFANASPFPGRKKSKDPSRTAVLAAVAVALVAFVASIIALFVMQAPVL